MEVRADSDKILLAGVLRELGNHNCRVMVTRKEILAAFIIVALSGKLHWIRERPDIWHDVVSLVERALNNVFGLDCEDDAAAFGALARLLFPPEYDVFVGVVQTGPNLVHAIFAIDGTVYDFCPQQKMPGGFVKSYEGAVWRRLQPYEGSMDIITGAIEIAGHALGVTGDSILDKLFDAFVSAKAPAETQPATIEESTQETGGSTENTGAGTLEAIANALTPPPVLASRIDEQKATIANLQKQVKDLQGDKKKSDAAAEKARQDAETATQETAKARNETQSVRAQLVSEQVARKAAEQVKAQQAQQLDQLQRALQQQLSSNRNAVVRPQVLESLDQLRNAQAYIASPEYLDTLTSSFLGNPDAYWQVMGTVSETGAALAGIVENVKACCDACAKGNPCASGACSAGHNHDEADTSGESIDLSGGDYDDEADTSGESIDLSGGDYYDEADTSGESIDLSGGDYDDEAEVGTSTSCITCSL